MNTTDSKIKPKTRRRLGWLLLLLALLTVFLGYITWIPFDLSKLERAIPEAATAISIHKNLAGRYDELSENIFIRSLMESAGITPDLLARHERELSRYAPFLAGHTTILAWVPHLPGIGRPGLVAASWMGSAALPARWIMELQKSGQWQRQPPFAGHSIWTLDRELNKAGWHLSATIYDGMILAWVSPDPRGLHEIIRCAERLAPSAAPENDTDFRTLSACADDRIWVRRPTTFAAALTEISNDKISFAVNASSMLPNVNTELTTSDMATPCALLADAPVMAAVFSADAVRHLMLHLPDFQSLLIEDLIPYSTNTGPAESCGFALLTGSDGGGFGTPPFRIKIPAVILFTRLANSQKTAQSRIRKILDHLNARYKLGLIAGPNSDSNSITTIETTTDNFLASLPADDLPAYAVVDDWLLIASNGGTLRRRITAAQSRMHAGTHPARWLAALESAPTSAFFWVDMQAGVNTIKLALTGMILTMRGSQINPPDWLTTAREWLENTSHMQEGFIRLVPDAPRLEIKVMAAPDS